MGQTSSAGHSLWQTVLGRVPNSPLKSGDIAPDFVLPTPDGQPVSLADTLQGERNAWLVFLRHLG